MTRFHAATIHLCISVLIVVTLIILMMGIWYPSQYFKLMGGGELIYLIGGIDICLGPLLTFAVFKSGKKKLKFDLAVIGLLQISALAYGSYTMFNARPVFTAFADGEFTVATANEITNDALAKAKNPEWKALPITGPVVVGISKPTDKKALEEIEFLSMGIGYAIFPSLFVPYESQKVEVLKQAKPISDLRTINKGNNAIVDEYIGQENRNEKDLVFVPISSFFGTFSAILDARTAAFITIIEAKPK